MADLVAGTNGTGMLWPGAIVGDLPNPSGCAMLDPTMYLTTGDLEAGDPCEFSNRTAFTVEFWFKTSGWPVGAEDIAFGPQTTTGFRQWDFLLNPTGTITLIVRSNTPASRTVSSATALTPIASFSSGPWYHIAGRVDGSALKLYVNGVEEASIVWSGQGENLGTTPGTLDMRIGCSVGTQSYFYDELAFYPVALGADRILAHYQAGTSRGFVNNQLPSERAIAALDSVSSHAPRRIGTGTRRMQPKFMTGQSPLEELQLARQAENVDASVFISKSGEVVFLDAAHRSSTPYSTVQMTLGDA